MEITESVVMEDALAAAEKIRQIQDLGVKVQMDDFGTGYSSLASLHRFPIGALKIAREFITEIASNEDRSEIIRTIISLARVMNMSVIAEGVENRGQLDYLKGENIDIWQGYYCSEPICPESVPNFIAESLV
jgi:EAL domain-containing protein (putative c-di-GMP-specific phosphodiesterase class I)